MIFYSIVATSTIIYFDGTGDAGDSIHHFLHAKYAFHHPVLFFDHWAKPIFVLLSIPFAQLGFTGMKVFNVLNVILTLILTDRVASKLKIKNSVIAPVILIFTPLYFILTFSGLTEPLFALLLILSIDKVLSKNHLAALAIVSFLPFVRSEGLIILGVFALYYIVKHQWKLLPLLAIGHVFYSITGYFAHGDFLWVFNKIPYAKMSSTYGSGELFHFAEQLYYVIGPPIYVLFGIGLIRILFNTLKSKTKPELGILITLGFFGFFIAHSLFWYLGIFNSMGLKRVMISVVPFIAIIGLMGYNSMREICNKVRFGILIPYAFILYTIVFPFTSNPAAINWKKDLSLSEDQILAKSTTDYILQNQLNQNKLIYSHPYLSFLLNVDHFDKIKREELSIQSIANMKNGDCIIWENWFSVTESGINKAQLDKDNSLIQLYENDGIEKGRNIFYVVYQKIK